MCRFCVLIVAIVAFASAFDKTFVTLPATPTEHKDAFDYLVTKHNRTYTSDAERARRLEIFTQNVQKIAALRKKNVRASFAPNLFFDLSESEFAASYRMKRRNVLDEMDKKHTIKTKSGASKDVTPCLAAGVDKKRAASANKPSALPKTFDYRTAKPAVLTPVKNQAACGSCWAFSATEALESAIAVQKKLAPPVLAPQQIVDCSTTCSIVANEETCDQGCDGGWPWAAIATLMIEGGQDSEASYPYQGVDGTCQFNKANVLAVPKNYTCISGPNLATDDDVKAAMLKYGPVSIAMDASPWQWYEFGIIDDSSGCSSTELDHAIQIVGWTTMRDVFFQETPVWIVRNSWSASWGYDGYIFIGGSGGQNYNTCGILSSVTAVNV